MGSRPMIPLRKLRSMLNTVESFIETVEPHADGSFDDGGGGWSDRDQTLRSLLEVHIYLVGWINHRSQHRSDPPTGGFGPKVSP